MNTVKNVMNHDVNAVVTTSAMVAKRSIEQIIEPEEPHWVGSGFRVRQYFPNGDTNPLNPPLLTRMSPFLLLDYNEPYYFEGSPFEKGVAPHPHKGFETVTFSFSGSLEHKDTAGNRGVMHSGDVQWMTAGKGVLHREYHEKEWSKKGRMLHAIQLWVNLPAANKNDEPHYQHLAASTMGTYTSLDETVSAIVYAGAFRNITGPGNSYTPMNIYKLTIEPNSYVSIREQANWNTGFLVINGSGTVNGESQIAKGQFIIMSNDNEQFDIDAGDEGLEIFVLSGEPIHEPIVKKGPFVMNNATDVLLAFGEFQNGKFGREEDLM